MDLLFPSAAQQLLGERLGTEEREQLEQLRGFRISLMLSGRSKTSTSTASSPSLAPLLVVCGDDDVPAGHRDEAGQLVGLVGVVVTSSQRSGVEASASSTVVAVCWRLSLSGSRSRLWNRHNRHRIQVLTMALTYLADASELQVGTVYRHTDKRRAREYAAEKADVYAELVGHLDTPPRRRRRARHAVHGRRRHRRLVRPRPPPTVQRHPPHRGGLGVSGIAPDLLDSAGRHRGLVGVPATCSAILAEVSPGTGTRPTSPRATPTAARSRCDPQVRRGGGRDWAIVAVLLYCGARVEECARLDYDDLVLTERTGTLRLHGKGDDVRTVPLPQQARKAIRAWLDDRGRDPGPLWRGQRGRLTVSGITQAVLAVGADADLPSLRPHRLRHTYATRLRQGGADPAHIQALLGHASIETSARYFRASSAEQAAVAEAAFDN